VFVGPKDRIEGQGDSMGLSAPETLLKTDACSLGLSKLPEGKIRSTSMTWPYGVTLLAGEIAEIRYEGGYIAIRRMPKPQRGLPRPMKRVASKGDG
jgi:hypothetical protein